MGFSDGESNFSVIPKLEKNGTRINRFSFRFTIKVHIDDYPVLVYVQSILGVGIVNKEGEECKFVVSNVEGIKYLITIFDLYMLNTTKYLDYKDFKEAFSLYHARVGLVTDELKDKILNLKNGMNSNRTNFNMPSNHIKITAY